MSVLDADGNPARRVDSDGMPDPRSDSVANTISGLGTGGDRHRSTQVTAREVLDCDELDQWYETGRFAGTIVDRPARDAVRKGVDLVVDEGDVPDGVEASDLDYQDEDGVASVLGDLMRRLGVKRDLFDALRMARQTGGAGLLVVTDDAQPLDKKVDWSTVTRVKATHVYDRFELSHFDWVEDLADERHDEPESYVFHPDNRGGPAMRGGEPTGDIIHHTRVIPFYGRRLRSGRDDIYDGWGQPVLDRVQEVLYDLETAIQGAASAVHEFQYDVLKIKGLMAKLSSSEGRDKIKRRIELMELTKSLINAVALDADGEALESRSVDFAGLVDIIGILKENLSLATRIPLSILFGQTPQGLSSNDETGRSNYHDFISGELQEERLAPALRRLGRFLFADKRSGFDHVPDFDVVFPPLSQKDEKQEAETDKTQAEAEKTRATIVHNSAKLGILSPREAGEALHPEIVEGQQDADYADMVEHEAKLRADGQIVARRADKALEDIDTVPPKGAQAAAQKALRWRDEHPDEIEGGTRVGWTRANQLADREALSEDVIGRMAAFDRHRENAEINEEYEGEPWKDAGYVAWLLWGGDTGVAWAQRKVEEFDRAREDATEAQRRVRAGDGQPEKQRKSDVGYVNSSPAGVEECDGCGWYLGDGQCGIVRGTVAPTGWCRLWGTAVFAAGTNGATQEQRDSYRTDPYSGPSDEDLPDQVAELPAEDRRQWVAVFNKVWADNGDLSREARETKAHRIANARV